MNAAQKQLIGKLRNAGLGYGTIASRLGLSLSTVKSYCRRNDISPNPSAADSPECRPFCPRCGRPVISLEKRKQRRFCSNACRVAWWNGHKDLVSRKAIYLISCTGCGIVFESYGNRNRKYCSHACYINARFGGRVNQ